MGTGAAVMPSDERQRLAAVRRYDILDTPPDGAFERIAALAARFLNVPIATVTIVDENRIWFKAAHGIEVDEIGRDPGLCASAVCQNDVYVVNDALQDPRTLNNPLVRGELGLRFYAAAPIRTHDGYNLGTVNVIDWEPRSITSQDMQTLQHLAGIATDELELRLATRGTLEREREQGEQIAHLVRVLQKPLLPKRAPRVPRLDLATYYLPAAPELDIGGDFIDVFEIDDGVWALVIGDVCGKGAEAAAVTGQVRHMIRALSRVERRPSALLALVNEAMFREGFDSDEPNERFCTACLVVADTSTPPVRIVASSAGHPLPLIGRADGRVEQLGVPGQFLGPFPQITLENASAELRAGDFLLLYTDGAVEQRGMSIAVGERALVAALERAPGKRASPALAHIFSAIDAQHDAIDDDIALILARAE